MVFVELVRIAVVVVLLESMVIVAVVGRNYSGLQLELELDRIVAAVALLAKLVLAMVFQLDRTIELVELALALELTNIHRLVRTTRLLSSPTNSCRCPVSILCPARNF